MLGVFRSALGEVPGPGREGKPAPGAPCWCQMMAVMGGTEGLSAAEQRVWEAFATGTLVNFGTGNAAADDPVDGGGWDNDRQVRAEVIAALLRGALSPEPGHAGRVWIRGARITGVIDTQDAEVGHVLRLERCHVLGGADLTDASGRTIMLVGCQVGPVSMLGATVTGRLSFRGSHLAGADGPALVADGLSVTGEMACDGGFRADGELRLPGASIGGRLTFRASRLAGRSGPALIANGLMIAGDMICDEGFRADGELRLPGARIGGRLSFTGATLDGAGGRALSADALTVGGAMFCDQGFRADGEILLQNASIHDDLSFTAARLASTNRPALVAIGLTVGGTMYCDDGFRADGEIILRNARIGVLADDGKDSWPQRQELGGLTYGDMRPYLPARERLDWLRRSADYQGQPFEELAAYYRKLGHDEQARRVLLAQQRERTRRRPWQRRGWGWLQDGLVGYGYAPGRALALLAVALVAGWAFFRAYQPPPVNPAAHPSFNAAIYTVNLLVPAPGLGDASTWNPHGLGLAMAAGLRALGWLLAITIIAAITRAVTGTKG